MYRSTDQMPKHRGLEFSNYKEKYLLTDLLSGLPIWKTCISWFSWDEMAEADYNSCFTNNEIANDAIGWQVKLESSYLLVGNKARVDGSDEESEAKKNPNCRHGWFRGVYATSRGTAISWRSSAILGFLYAFELIRLKRKKNTPVRYNFSIIFYLVKSKTLTSFHKNCNTKKARTWNLIIIEKYERLGSVELLRI